MFLLFVLFYIYLLFLLYLFVKKIYYPIRRNNIEKNYIKTKLPKNLISNDEDNDNNVKYNFDIKIN